jgi:hypothetical protein
MELKKKSYIIGFFNQNKINPLIYVLRSFNRWRMERNRCQFKWLRGPKKRGRNWGNFPICLFYKYGMTKDELYYTTEKQKLLRASIWSHHDSYYLLDTDKIEEDLMFLAETEISDAKLPIMHFPLPVSELLPALLFWHKFHSNSLKQKHSTKAYENTTSCNRDGFGRRLQFQGR